MSVVLRGISAAAAPLRTLRIASDGVQKKLLNTVCGTTSNKCLERLNLLGFYSKKDEKAIEKSSTLQFSPSSIISMNEPRGFRLPIMDMPQIPISTILPKITNIPIIESPGVIHDMDCPTNDGIVEKQAARLIVIRRKKMRRHKLKKLRKRTKFTWRKIKLRRKMKKEKAFQSMLMSKIKAAEAWSPEKYVDNKLKEAYAPRIPHYWKGKRLPLFIIRQLMGIDKKIEYKPYKF